MEGGAAGFVALQLMEDGVDKDDTVVYTGGSVVHHWFGWGFSVRMGGKVVAEQSRPYRSSASSVRMEVAAMTTALRWLSGTKVTKTIKVAHSWSALHEIHGGCIWHR